MKSIFLLVVSCIMLQCFSCTSLISGTTDTGNAKISAEIYTLEGTPASGAEVTILPAQYLFYHDDSVNGTGSSENILIMETDDSGCFRVDSLKSGDYSIEVNNGNSAVLFKISIPVEQDSVIVINDTLKSYGSFEGNMGIVEDTTFKRYLLIYGLKRCVEILPDGKFFIGDLPPGTFNLKITASEDDHWKPVEINHITVLSEDTLPISFAGWKYRAQIILNTTENGADVVDNVYGFPVLVKLSDSNFNFNEAHKDGFDCAFYKNDSTPLPFHIELWDSLQEVAYIWVRVDTVFGNSMDQSFIMLWGNSNAQLLSRTSQVFDTADGFLGCYHFGGDVSDATVNKYDGTDKGTMDMSNGIIGRARMFNGTGYINLGELPDRPEGAISCWMCPGFTVNSYSGVTQGIWGKYEMDEQDFTLSLQGSDFYSGSGSPGKLISKLEDTTDGYYLASKTSSFIENIWYHVVWTWGEDGNILYVNGKLESSSPDYRPVWGKGNDEIGRSYYDSSNISGGGPLYFTGVLDEFRIDKAQRSESWVRLCYTNQLLPNSLISIKKEDQQ